MDLITLALSKKFTSDAIEAIDEAKVDKTDIVQSDWNQNNETALNYIKNRPFYEGEDIEKIIFPETTLALDLVDVTDNGIDDKVSYTQDYITLGIQENIVYDVYIDGELYTLKCNFVADPLTTYTLGDENFSSAPFYIKNIPLIGLTNITFNKQLGKDQITLCIKEKIKNIKKIERRFIDNIAGMDVEGKIFTIDDVEYTAQDGAEIFNDYNKNIAVGQNSHAEGTITKAIGLASHAEGCITTASGMHSHAEGYNTTASGGVSHAEGYNTVASGNYSHAEGNGTIVYGESQHVQGSYNIEDVVDSYDKGTYAHIVGNGNYSSRSNAHTLDWDGNAWYQGDVYVGSTSGTNKDEGSKKLATEEYVNTEVANLVNSAPETLDTLGELATAMKENSDIVEVLNESITNKADKSEIVQSDYNQNDETSSDFIKNKPFYDTGGFKWADLVINPSIDTGMFGNCYNIKPGAQFALDKEYKVVIDDKEYICSPRYMEYSDGFSGIAIGAEISGGLFLAPSTFKDESIPFHIVNSSGNSLNAVFPNNQAPTNLQIYIKQADMKLLDRKFIDYIPGERVSGKEVIYNDTKTICGNGAEVFNNLESNIAIGDYSHAEGIDTVAKGEGAHAEGVGNIADGSGSHAEGYYTKASNLAHSEGHMTSATGQGTHAEGTSTIASGMWSHAEGGYTEARGYHSHAEGYGTIAATINSHVQGMYNEIDTEQENKPIYGKVPLAGGNINSATFDLDKIIYTITNPSLNCQTGLFNADSFTEITAKDLKINDIFVLNNTNDFGIYYSVTSLENNDEKIKISQDVYGSYIAASLGKYVHIIGNGFGNKARSNAHTLDWEGNAWYQGTVEATGLILSSPNGTRFKITVGDDGVLTSTKFTEEEKPFRPGDAYKSIV